MKILSDIILKQKKLNHQHGIAFIEAALTIPLLIMLVIAGGYVFQYIRAYQIVRYAAETAAGIASSSEIKSVNSSASDLLTWSQDIGGASKPYRPFAFIDLEACRDSEDSALEDCYTAVQTNKREYAFVWSNYATSLASPLDKTYKLPFQLYEESSSTPGYSPVQLLPIIGIERACFEPYNETGGLIVSSGRYYDTSTAGNCTHVKPMYWQSPLKADFDGDRKEDIVFFKPRGTSTTWGAKVSSSEIDFIVFYSGAAYSGTAGHGYFNLSTSSSSGTPGVTPNDIPIVADYDRDGLADYGVFDPRTGNYRIAFSYSNYMVIGSGSMGVSDASGEKGLIAIPGHYTSSEAVQLLVVQTGGAAGNRFDMYISDLIQIDSEDLDPSSGLTLSLPNGHAVSGNEVSAANIYKVKPHPGTTSTIAFADYDDDGITELGYLSWYGGHLAKQVAGKVTGLRNGSAAISTFESTDSISGTALEARMNPFDMDFDSAGNLFFLDSIDGRMWMIPQAGLSGSADTTITAIMPTHASEATRDLGASPSTYFPNYNVWNIPADTRTLSESDDTGTEDTAGSRSLRTPRKFFIADDYDDAMYIADYGNARILKVSSGGATIDSNSTSKVILGGNTCIDGSCVSLSNGGISVSDMWGDQSGRYQIWPSAITLVPDPSNSDKYFVAFSSGNLVYLITHEGTSGGPNGDGSDRIWKIAGQAATTITPNFTDSNSNYVNNFVSADSDTVTLCSVIDLKYAPSDGSGALYIATSCSLTTTPSESPLINWDSGGILKLIPNSDYDYPTFIDEGKGFTTKIERMIGSFWVNPCMRGLCAAPTASEIGLYQRKVNITQPASNVDLINPVDMEIGSNGELYFINQWHSDQITNATQYPLTPNIRDSLNTYSIFIWDGPSKPNNLNILNNPFLLGDGVTPFLRSDWASPYNRGSEEASNPYILAHRAPIKNIPFPATAALAINSSAQLFTSNPYLQNNTDVTPHPYNAEIADLGTIYGVDLDLDGDGSADSSDTDIDGDGVANGVEGTNRSAFCPEIYGTTANQRCRAQEKFGIPRQTFFKLQNGDLRLAGEGSTTETGAPSSKNYGEFLLINSVSECGTAADCTQYDEMAATNVRSEPWATLFNWGDDADWGSTDVCTESLQLGYDNCLSTSNGPIAAPQPLHVFAGQPDATVSLPYSSYPGYHYTANTAASGGAEIDEGLFLFPNILSSTRPKENGIKPTKRVAIGSKSPGIDRSGVLCRDYKPEAPALDGSFADGYAAPFQLNFDSYLGNYFYTGYTDTFDPGLNNDHYNYAIACDLATNVFPLTDGRQPAVEGIVLQLDHDDTTNKAAGSGDTHWPNQWISGSVAEPENARILTFIDHDGNGVRDPTFLLPPTASGSSAFDSEPMANPYLLVATGILDSSNPYDTNTINYIDKFRLPFSTAAFMNGKYMLSLDEDTIAPPYLRLDANYDGGFYSTFDSGRSSTRGTTMFLSLDFEPFIGRKLSIGTRQDVGAGMYSNYARSSRFRLGQSNQKQPPLIAAQNILRIGLGLAEADIIAATTPLTYGKAHIVYLKDGELCGAAISSTSKVECDSVKVSYATKYLGNTVTISVTQPLNQGYLYRYKEKCDPDAALAAFPCS